MILTAAAAAATATVAAADARPLGPADIGDSAAVSAPIGGAVAAAGDASPAEALGAAGIVTTASGAVAGCRNRIAGAGYGWRRIVTDSAPGGAIAASGGESPAAGHRRGRPRRHGHAAWRGRGRRRAVAGRDDRGAALDTPVTVVDDGSGFSIPDPGPEAIVGGGLVLLIAGAGVVAARSRRRPALP